MCTGILRHRDVNSLPNQNETLTSPSFNHHHHHRRDSNKSSRRQKKALVTGMRNSCNRSLVEKSPTSNLVMEKVTILKRGEELKVEADSDDVKDRRVRDSVNKRTVRFVADKDNLALCPTDRLGPEPETLSEQIRVRKLKVVECSSYAGWGPVLSPPPSSVPVPVFCANMVATTDLRRILKLDDLI